MEGEEEEDSDGARAERRGGGDDFQPVASVASVVVSRWCLVGRVSWDLIHCCSVTSPEPSTTQALGGMAGAPALVLVDVGGGSALLSAASVPASV